MNFMVGADTSCLEAMEDQGAKYYDIDGKEDDAIKILAAHGVNFIRLRLFNRPTESFDGGDYCDLKHTLHMAERIKQYELGFMLDFHYSDFWADWKAQTIPSDWKNQSEEELKQSLYEYTKTTLESFIAQGTVPDVVQIGNEIGKGLLWEYGSLDNPDKITGFLNAGLKAVEEINRKGQDIKTMLHIECGADRERSEEFFTQLYNEGISDFDYIGLSYYPYWSGEYKLLTENMRNLYKIFHKQIAIVETAFPYTDKSHDDMDNIVTSSLTKEMVGLEASVANQKKVTEEIIDIVKSEESGAGVFYWEPVWYQKAGVGVSKGKGNEWENQAMFDHHGHALNSITAFGK